MGSTQQALAGPVAYSTDLSESPSPSAAKSAPLHWTPLNRLAFRIAFLYFFCFLFLFDNGTLFNLIPVAGEHIQTFSAGP